MKQMILLEPEDLAALRHGESRTLQIGTAEIVLGYAGPVLSRNGARPVPVTAEFVCETCGKAFNAANKLGSHRFQAHKTRMAPSAGVESSDRTCPTCGRVGRTRFNMLEHHRRVHGRPSPTSRRPAAASAAALHGYARQRYKDVVIHAYGADRCSACHKTETKLQLFPTTADGWRTHRKQPKSSWVIYKRVADMIKQDGMTATKKLWHYGCRSCMHTGANAARKEA